MLQLPAIGVTVIEQLKPVINVLLLNIGLHAATVKFCHQMVLHSVVIKRT